MTRDDPSRSRAARWRTATALLLALACAVGTGLYSFDRLTPNRAEAMLTPGQSVVAHGVRYRLDTFTVAATLPAEKSSDPPVHGPAGSVLVLVVVTQTVVDHAVALDDHFCDVTLVADDGSATWVPDSDVTYAIRRPAAYGCAATASNPLAYDVARPMGFSFVVPATAAGSVAARLSSDDDAVVVAFRP